MAEQMNVEPGTKPNPDPTVATNDAVERAMKSERDYVDGVRAVLEERLAAIDRATELRLVGIIEIPSQIDEKVENLRGLMDEQFVSVRLQFAERDTRSERESRDNKVAVDAAFAAQKEAAAKQDEANAKAIEKSERATAETIKTNQELSASKTDGLTKGLDEVKLAISRLDATKQGAHDQKIETRQGFTFMQGIAVGGAVLLLTVLNIVGIVYSSRTSPVQPVVTVPSTTP